MKSKVERFCCPFHLRYNGSPKSSLGLMRPGKNLGFVSIHGWQKANATDCGSFALPASKSATEEAKGRCRHNPKGNLASESSLCIPNSPLPRGHSWVMEALKGHSTATANNCNLHIDVVALGITLQGALSSSK